jgi:hypothetical protein
MKTYTAEELKSVLSRHALYLRGKVGGERADLQGADLQSADLQDADLRGADLRGADLRDANLQGADLRGANLQGAFLQGAFLQGANLQGANLQRADLQGANLQGADLRGADLERADLRGAYLRSANLRSANLQDAFLQGADLRGANLQGAYLRGANLPAFQLCPEEGDFVAWKKVRGAVLKLLVTGKRTSSLIGRKCRASEVKVLEAYPQATRGAVETITPETPPQYSPVFESIHDRHFTYQVGEVAREESYNDDIRVECTRGIHFFMTRKEAEEYT